MVEIRSLGKRLGKFSLSDISFKVGEGDYLVLLGESGAGKTLLLEMMAGIYQPDEGNILLNGEDLTHKPIQERSFGLVFQDLALFPHFTVRQNIRFPLRMHGSPAESRESRIEEIAAELEIGEYLDRYPNTLSGGQRQRVALARTLVSQPKCLLLDEPLTALDTRLKSEMRNLLKGINEKGQTIIHVTHSYDEAFFLASHIGIISAGRMTQFGTREAVLREPGDPWISDYIRTFNL